MPSFPAHQVPGHIPGEDWQIDFTHMPPTQKIKLMLTLVDTFSGWVEAFPTRSETASEVTQFLIWEIIPCFGLPLSFQSNNGPAFISQITQQVVQCLGITWKLHILYRPSAGVQLQQPGTQPEGMSCVSGEWCSLWLKVWDCMFISSFRFSFILWQKH